MQNIKSLITLTIILLVTQAARGQVAITEFVNDALGDETDTGREWVELFNSGDELSHSTPPPQSPGP